MKKSTVVANALYEKGFKVKEMLLGSVSEAVIRKSKQPVLVVKRESEV